MDEILTLHTDRRSPSIDSKEQPEIRIDLKDNLLMAAWILKELEELDKRLTDELILKSR